MRKQFIILFFILTCGFLKAQISLETLQAFTTDKLHDVEFVNDSVGFVYTYGTGKVFKTNDQGKSWKLVLQTDSIYLEQIQFINNNVGFLCGEKGTLFKTSNQGETWENACINIDTANILIYGMHFKDESQGLLGAGFYANRKLQPVLLATADEAETFEASSWNYAKMILNIAPNENVLWKTGTGYILKDTIEVFKDTLNKVGQIRSIAFGLKGTIIAVSLNGFAIISTDDGGTWQAHKIFDTRLRCISFLGNETWFAVGDKFKEGRESNFISYNNGKSWEAFNNGIPDLHRCFKINNKLWMVGDMGFIGITAFE